MFTAPLGSSLSGVSPIKMRSSSFDDDTDRGHLGGDKVHSSGSDIDYLGIISVCVSSSKELLLILIGDTPDRLDPRGAVDI